MIAALIISLLHSSLDNVSLVKQVSLEKLRKRLMKCHFFDSFSCWFVWWYDVKSFETVGNPWAVKFRIIR